MDSPDFPGRGIPYIGPAVSITPGRPDGPPVLGVLHATANTATPTQEANYAARANPASAHWYAGDASPALVQAVRLVDSAWHVGGRFGNRRGVALEVCGLVSQSRSAWLADDRDIRAAGLAIALTAARTGIRMRWLSDPELLELYRTRTLERSGWCTHQQYNRVVPDARSDHNDPGPGCPLDVVMDAARAAAGQGGVGMLSEREWAIVTAITGGAVTEGDMANVAPEWARGFRAYTIDNAIAAARAVGEQVAGVREQLDQGVPVTLAADDRKAIADAAGAATTARLDELERKLDAILRALHAAGVGLAG